MVNHSDQFDEKKAVDEVHVLDHEVGSFEETTAANFDDPNLGPVDGGDFEEDSPYPEVRAAVANTDDPDIPVNTLRVWIIGLMWAILIPGLNQ